MFDTLLPFSSHVSSVTQQFVNCNNALPASTNSNLLRVVDCVSQSDSPACSISVPASTLLSVVDCVSQSDPAFVSSKPSVYSLQSSHSPKIIPDI